MHQRASAIGTNPDHVSSLRRPQSPIGRFFRRVGNGDSQAHNLRFFGNTVFYDFGHRVRTGKDARPLAPRRRRAPDAA